MTLKPNTQRTPPPNNLLEAARIASTLLERRRAKEAAERRLDCERQMMAKMTEGGDDKRL